MKFGISERFRLEIHWGKVVCKQEGTSKLIGCHLNGPAVKEVLEMKQEDYIDLDFGNQYLIFVSRYYISNLSWRGVKHTPDKIYLDNVILTNKFVNYIPKLNDDDFIVVDTENHENEKHQYHFTYTSYLVRNDGDVYNFGG